MSKPAVLSRFAARIRGRADDAGATRLPERFGLLPLAQRFPPCGVCGGHDRRALYVRKRFIATGCGGCGVLQTFPQPSDEEIEAYYAAAEGWERGKTLPEGDALEAFLLRRRRPYRHEIERLSSSLAPPTTSHGQLPRVLDFGCGLGITLDIFAELGWETFGIEPAPGSARIAAERHALLDRIPSEPTFDLIVAAHVFEHVPRPLDEARALARATVDGGQIYVGVPNVERLDEHGHFRHLLNTQHLFAYSLPAMTALLTAAGFGAVRRLEGAAWESVRDSVRSLRTLARRGVDPGAAPEAEPLLPAIEALRRYAETSAGREYLGRFVGKEL